MLPCFGPTVSSAGGPRARHGGLSSSPSDLTEVLDRCAAVAAEEHVEGGRGPARLDDPPLDHIPLHRIKSRHLAEPVVLPPSDVVVNVGEALDDDEAGESGVAHEDKRHDVLRPGEVQGSHAGEDADHHLEEAPAPRKRVVEHQRIVELGPPVAPLRDGEHPWHVGGVLVVEEDVYPVPEGGMAGEVMAIQRSLYSRLVSLGSR